MTHDELQKEIDFVNNINVSLGSWCFLSQEEAKSVSEGLSSRFPGKNYIVFARRNDTDDRGCIVIDKKTDSAKCIFLHDYASPGWETDGKSYSTIFEWISAALNELYIEKYE